MHKGRITIPTDSAYVEGTKRFMKYWKADAVRDCDGVSLPENLKQFQCDVYKAYFIVREDHDYAKKHEEFWQNVALMSKRCIAEDNILEVNLLENTFEESFKINSERIKEFWQVIDRTTGIAHEQWEYIGGNTVRIYNCEKYHEYTVNFFAKNCWDPVQIYNYHVNHWNVEKDIDLDPIYPEALEHMLSRMEKWLQKNPDVTTVRFTTFFYNFFIVNVTGTIQRIWDWHNYAMTASPKMFDLFHEETGENITLEDIIAGGYYSNRFLIPDKVMRKYIDFVQKKCAAWAKLFVDLCHKYGKKAMMFDGDHRIGVEPYSPYFQSIGLDAVVGAPSSSIYIQQIANIKGVQFTEGRLNPYFFPNECPGDEKGTAILKSYWKSIRRGLLKKPIDRIGFGGYLKQIENYPKLIKAIKAVCDEFRQIREMIGHGSCCMMTKVAVISYWGKLDSWMQNGIFVDDVRQDGYFYSTMMFALSVLPVKVDFLSFEDVVKSGLENYDVVISNGLPGTSFQGDKCWANPELVSSIRRFVDEGGGFIGVGEPSGYQYQGRYFQLSDVLGLEKECNFTHFEKRNPIASSKQHWITENIDFSKIRFNPNVRGIYPLTATVLSAHFDDEYPLGYQNAGHVDFAVNEYGNGRSVYFSGLSNINESYRLIYKAILWAGKNEEKFTQCYCDNPSIDVYYYNNRNKYAVINLSDNKVSDFYRDINGYKREIVLKPNEIQWIDEK